MNKDMFQKLLTGKRNELEYRLMRYYYNKDMDVNIKIAFMFEQYADTLKDIAHVATGYCRSDDAIQLTPEQVDNITSTLGGLFLEYNMKLQDISINDVLGAVLNEFTDVFEEDNEDEE